MKWMIVFYSFTIAPFAWNQTPEPVQKLAVNTCLQLDTVLINKTFPEQFKSALQLVLPYFPELKTTSISIVIQDSSSPFMTMPSVFKKNKQYTIIVADQLRAPFNSIVWDSLSFNAQLGVLAHELAHVAYFEQKKGINWLGVAFSFSIPKLIDRAEQATDISVIEHGLGFQLYQWSSEVRQQLNVLHWNGTKGMKKLNKDRYLSPVSIAAKLILNQKYKHERFVI